MYQEESGCHRFPKETSDLDLGPNRVQVIDEATEKRHITTETLRAQTKHQNLVQECSMMRPSLGAVG